MALKNFFLKPIERPIETVIKADDREHISDEVQEYVITHEVAKKISNFFQAYTEDHTVANGVWISGFFGSGKSHLLKILSYVLQNLTTEEGDSGEIFANKIEDDAMLQGSVKKSIRIPSESILFNIDQQAGKERKSDENAVLSVFYKVFFDHLGYYGFQPHVAEFEFWLDQKGKFEEFKKEFKNQLDEDWEKARLDYFDPEVSDAIHETLGKINNTDAAKYEGILDTLQDKQKQSIENFCERVHQYIQTKPKGFRLNFFVDEIGQYISDNTKLMLNLQTIAESLATKTKGASWILVTSQEDIQKVVGDMDKKQANDFSRIQARFAVKIPLTSANVDEVIEKRLLKKTADADKKLHGVYQKEKNNLGTLLSFSDVGVQFKGYKSEKDFSNKFPFVPYQFDLFQQCRRALSTHNAFQGKHASVGERSMLGVFQQVVQAISTKNENALVSFDTMFEGIRNELKGEIQGSITLAEKQLDSPFHLQVLKALFMVKYFPNFKTTKRNISVLMINEMHVDLKKHEQMVEEALNNLENQSYIQRNGEVYEFLTDDEKDVEREIKDTEVDEGAVSKLLSDILFDEIIKDSKIQFAGNKQYYDFSRKIDGTILGRPKELDIEIITPNNDNYTDQLALQSQTMGTPTMRMILGEDAIFMKDVKMYLRTNKYVKQSQTTSNRAEIKRILQEKSHQNNARRRNLKTLANKLLGHSKVYINGTEKEMTPTDDGKTKVIKAFQHLVKVVYPNLTYLNNIIFTEDTLRNTIRNPQAEIFNTDDKTISGAESEILNKINRRKSQSDRTSLHDLKTEFSKKPYGWYPNAIWTLIAKLYKRGKIELRQNGNLLDDEASLDSMLNSKNHLNTIIEVQRTENPAEVKALKKCYNELFDATISSSVGKEIAVTFQSQLQTMQREVENLLMNQAQYPFLKALHPLQEQLKKISNKEYNFYLSKLKDFKEPLLDAKEDILDPIKKFWNGEQLNIFQNIGSILQSSSSNLDYIDGEEAAKLREVYHHAKPYSGSLIKDGKAAMDALDKKVKTQIKIEKTLATKAIEAAMDNLKGKSDFQQLGETEQGQLLRPFNEELTQLKDRNFIANIRDVKMRVNENLLPQRLNVMMQMLQPTPSASGNGAAEKKVEYINKSKVVTDYAKKELTTETDVDEYVESLRTALKVQIKNHKRIII